MDIQVQEHRQEMAQEPAAMRIELFGPTRARAPRGVISGSDLGGVKPRQILEMLAVSAGTPVPKERLAELLWDGHPPRSYLGTLESYICVLRRRLGLGGSRAGIVTVMHGYLLDPEVIDVDLASFRRLVRTARAGAGDAAFCLSTLQQALDLVVGDLLATETYATWAIREREQFHGELVSAAGLAAAQAMTLGRPEVAVRMAGLAIAHDRLAEDSWRLLMQAQCALGRRSEALRSYSDLRELLADELGSDPSGTTTELYLHILRADEVRGSVTHVTSHDEVRMLVRVLRQALGAVPGFELGREDRAVVQAAVELTAAS